MKKLLVRILCITTFGLVNFSSANKFENYSESQRYTKDDVTTQSSGLFYVATTPKIYATTEKLSRYEQGFEDYEEAVARVDKIKEERQRRSMDSFSQISAALSMFSLLSSAWNRVSNARSLDNKEPHQYVLYNHGYDFNDTEKTGQIKHVLKRDMSDNTNSDGSNDVEEGRYIKGDPLKGYYDFVITEGSYKFWAAFQLFTAALMIYSTFAAIYYSKVNPIVSDYDYISYLGGRSMADDPEPETVDASNRADGPSSSLLNSQWLQTASHSFQFVMDAIDRIPAES